MPLSGDLIYSSADSLQCPRPRPPPASMPFSYLGPPTPPQEQDRNRLPLASFFDIHPRSPSPPSYPTTGSNVLMGRSSYRLFISTRSRVIRIFNLPKDPSSQLASLFHPATPHSPVTLWSLREEYGGSSFGDEDSVWAVFKSHEQAAAALSLSGGTVSVATALESDLEPFQKLRKLELRRHSDPSIISPQPSSRQHYQSSLGSPNHSPILPSTHPHSRIADLSRLGLPLRSSHSVSDLRPQGLDGNQNSGEEYGFTLSSNPPNPRNTFRQGDWICGSLNCAAHNFMRNVVCIGCGSPRPVAGPSATAPNPSFSLPWPRVASSPRFGGVPPSEFISGGPHSNEFVSRSDMMLSHPSHSEHVESHASFIPPSPLSVVTPLRSLPKVTSLPSLPNGGAFTSSASFSPSGHCFSSVAPSGSNGSQYSPTHSFAQMKTSFSPTATSFSPTSGLSPIATSFPTSSSSSSSSSSTVNVAAAAVALKLPSILTPSGRAFSIGGKVQNVSSDPLAPCVLYWPDNEPFPEQGQIRPPGNVGAQPPPILNTGNKGPIEQQPGDWVCRKCDYLNWRRRKVCQTCFPYAEGNTDGVSASVQAERIAMLAQVLGVSQPQVHGAQQLFSTHPQTPQLLIHTNQHAHSHSIPTPPNDTIDYLYRSPISPVISSPESEYFPSSTSSWRGPLLPSFLDDDDYVPHTPSPATPPLSVGSSSPHSTQGPTLRKESSSSSLSFPNSSSIWALKKEEVETSSTR